LADAQPAGAHASPVLGIQPSLAPENFRGLPKRLSELTTAQKSKARMQKKSFSEANFKTKSGRQKGSVRSGYFGGISA
jgi:hypothetical protein